MSFLEWAKQFPLSALVLEGRGLYGQDQGDEKRKGTFGDMMSDNDIAEGDWEERLTQLALAWAKAVGPAKDQLRQQVDDYTHQLLQIGNSPTRVLSIVSRATHDGRPSTFMRRAKRSAW